MLGRLLRDGEAPSTRGSLAPAHDAASQAASCTVERRIQGFVGTRRRAIVDGGQPSGDAAEIVRRISDGTGLLVDDGASVGNLLTAMRRAAT